MKPKTIFIGILISAVCSALSLHAQPAFEGPPPSREVLQSADQRNAAYAARINEVLDWRIGLAKPETLDMATIAMLLVRNQDIERESLLFHWVIATFCNFTFGRLKDT